MKRFLVLLLLAGSLFGAAPKKPKLVLAIVIDQFRYDYLTRFRSEYRAGFDHLLTKGALFTNARYIHFPNLTAVGHSTFLSGATPSVSGIVGNEWFDREENRKVTSVSDSKAKMLGYVSLTSPPTPVPEAASPRRMLVDTIGDELKMATRGKSRVIGISLKDRAAILPVGHMADAAYWFELKTGNFVSSDYYFQDLPAWVKKFNSERMADQYRGKTWMTHKLPDDLPTMYGDSNTSPFEASPFGNDVLMAFVERALASEPLGKDDITDVLAVSFSSNDKVGHDFGMYSPEEREITLLTDKALEKLFQVVDKQVGMDNVLVVLTGDHGVVPSAEEAATNRMPGGLYTDIPIRKAIEDALTRQYGAGDWISGHWDYLVYLNLETIAQKKLDAAEVRRTAAAALMTVPHIARAYTRDQLLQGAFPVDEMMRRVVNGFHTRRSPDVLFMADPFWMVTTAKATTHGSPYGYDAHVPILFMGPWVRPGKYHGTVSVNDIAPTLATLLEIETPAGSVGRVLTEILY